MTTRTAPHLHVDWTRCDGRGLCAELLPHTVTRDQWGYPVPLDGTREPVIAPGDRAHAGRAVSVCPLQALSIE
ncbi:ferredoxin [Gordonia rhizosphera]|uniref:Putative oxidoreductase n=1 Tax=Gordonia rhizosphera NBRC 16068 TaxID=1108045 RepID=K6WCM1_9ACTN|nr:ferredoxin [Gordonia rhizosphera]GAB91481.1 putative oxidoreductase [Gordonia rhizosphera NBRC 16068]